MRNSNYFLLIKAMFNKINNNYIIATIMPAICLTIIDCIKQISVIANKKGIKNFFD